MHLEAGGYRSSINRDRFFTSGKVNFCRKKSRKTKPGRIKSPTRNAEEPEKKGRKTIAVGGDKNVVFFDGKLGAH